MSYLEAIEKAEHFAALGQTTVYINEDGAPWGKAEDVEAGAGYRFSGPCGCYIVAHERGLTLKWSVDFEGRDANGRGVSLFDRPRLRDVMMMLPPVARSAFRMMLTDKVLPDLAKRTAELREALNQQWDSEDCVRGLIEMSDTAV